MAAWHELSRLCLHQEPTVSSSPGTVLDGMIMILILILTVPRTPTL